MVKKVLFACIKNAGRSQMANALFNSMCHAEDAVSISAGTEPADHVHANVAELLMQEKGLDISKAEPTKLTAELATGMDILVTMGCGEKCPYVPGLKIIEWQIVDPNNKPADEVKVILGSVEAAVVALIKEQGWRVVMPSVAETMLKISASNPSVQRKMTCKVMQLEKGERANMCGSNELCVPGEYDQEASCATCDVPQDREFKCGIAMETDGFLMCRITAEKESDGMKKACPTTSVEELLSGSEKASALRSTVMAQLSWVDKLLPVWIILAMVLGVLLGVYVPSVADALVTTEWVDVSLPIAVGLWMMMLPVLTKVKYEALGVILKQKGVHKQFTMSFVLNWLIGPFLMLALAWACLPDLENFRNGVIMVGLARCIAMVLIWNQLSDGDPELCAVLVAFNSILQCILYAPLTVLFLEVISGSSGIQLEWWLVIRSVIVFLGIPLVGGIILHYGIIGIFGQKRFDMFMTYFGPCALLALIYTIIVMFAIQGENIIERIGSVCRVAVPMFLYFNLMFFGTLFLAFKLKINYAAAVTQAFTASSNNFELAIAVAIAIYGVESDEALAATVGPLIEVPVLLALVYVALWINERWWKAHDADLRARGLMGPDIRELMNKFEDEKKITTLKDGSQVQIIGGGGCGAATY